MLEVLFCSIGSYACFTSIGAVGPVGDGIWWVPFTNNGRYIILSFYSCLKYSSAAMETRLVMKELLLQTPHPTPLQTLYPTPLRYDFWSCHYDIHESLLFLTSIKPSSRLLLRRPPHRPHRYDFWIVHCIFHVYLFLTCIKLTQRLPSHRPLMQQWLLPRALLSTQRLQKMPRISKRCNFTAVCYERV